MQASSGHRTDLYLRILEEYAHPLSNTDVILDYGCGAGATVSSLRELGYTAHGCDIKLREPGEHLRLIDASNRLPFDDETFDIVFSDQVLEHVRDHDRVFSEIARVLKPGGISFHRFPAKWRPIESHIHVPFGSVLRNFPWLYFWALLGVRNAHQKGQGALEVARKNHAYMLGSTNYATQRTLLKIASPHFARIEFNELLLLKHGSGRSRYLYSAARWFPPVVSLYAALVSHLMVMMKP